MEKEDQNETSRTNLGKRGKRGNRCIMSIDDFPEQEPIAYPNTPLSKEACYSIGCKPKELLYMPPECFEGVSQDKNIQRMHFNFYEAKRRGLIKAVKNEKQKIIQDINKNKITLPSLPSASTFSPNYSMQGKNIRTGPNTSRTSLYKSNEPSLAKNLHTSIMSLDSVERAKEKHMKFMQNLLKQEEKAAQKMKELENQWQMEREMEENLKRQKQKEENQKNEIKRLQEIERRKKAEIEEKQSKKKAISLVQKNLEENKRSQERFSTRLLSLQQKQNETEQKRREHQQKTELNLIENELKLKEKLDRRDREEQERKQNLEKMRKQQIQEMKRKKELNEQKRLAVLEMMESRLSEKKKRVIQKLNNQEYKFEKYIDNKLVQMEKLRSISVQRDLKIEKTKFQAESILKEKKEKISQKQEIAQKHLEETKKQQEISLIYKKELGLLKVQQLEEDRKRNMRRQEYQKQKLKRKLKQLNEKTELFIIQKMQLQRDRVQINTESQMQRTRVKELVNQMSVKNKWDPDLLMSAFKTTPENRSISNGLNTKSIR